MTPTFRLLSYVAKNYSRRRAPKKTPIARAPSMEDFWCSRTQCFAADIAKEVPGISCLDPPAGRAKSSLPSENSLEKDFEKEGSEDGEAASSLIISRSTERYVKEVRWSFLSQNVRRLFFRRRDPRKDNQSLRPQWHHSTREAYVGWR